MNPVDMLVDGRLDPAVHADEVKGGWTQLILCNNHEETGTVSRPITGDMADTGSLGLDASYHLFDSWNDRFLGEIDNAEAVSQQFKPRQALADSLHRKKDHRQFLSTNRHAMQGMADAAGSSHESTDDGLSELALTAEKKAEVKWSLRWKKNQCLRHPAAGCSGGFRPPHPCTCG